MEAVEVLSLVGGYVDEELLARNEYLAAENEILRSKIAGAVKLTNGERIRLAIIGKRIGLKALRGVANIVKPETILKWFRQLVARKFDGSARRGKSCGRPNVSQDIEGLILRFARENADWGYDRIVGALSNLGIVVTDQTVGNVLKRNGFRPAPKRKPEIAWADFIKAHEDVLCACDFFTTEVITRGELMTYYVLFFIQIASRKVHIAGVTVNPDEQWMKQMARNATSEHWGFLSGQKYLIHDRDSKFSEAFRAIIKAGGVEPIRLPARSPNLNAFSERWVRSVKEACLSKLVLFSERSLRMALTEYVTHFHEERNHQGKGNVLLFPPKDLDEHPQQDEVESRERLGGLLKYYYRKAA